MRPWSHPAALRRVTRILLLALGLWGGVAPAASAPTAAVLALRPVRDERFARLELDKLTEAQALRVRLESALALISGREVLSHEGLQLILGQTYLVNVFSCAGSVPCARRYFTPLRRAGVQLVLMGEVRLGETSHQVRLRSVNLDRLGVIAEVRFTVPAADSDSAKVWEAPLAELLAKVNVTRLSQDSSAGFAQPAEAETPPPSPADTSAAPLPAAPSPADAPPAPAGQDESAEKRTPAVAVRPGADPPTGRFIQAAPVTRPVVIDGHLDDAVWKAVPPDDRFQSLISVPYGQPSQEPTSVQVAYDAQTLYVALRCNYKVVPSSREVSAASEFDALDSLEWAGVAIDGQHDHASSRTFLTTPNGTRIDLESSNNGRNLNIEWRGIWQVATHVHENGWTAEFAIPWTSAAAIGRAEDAPIGINFLRLVPTTPEATVWSVWPGGPSAPVSSFFGHLTGVKGIRSSNRLLFAPYLSMRAPGSQVSLLRDLSNGGLPFAPYAGAYARLQPADQVQLHLAFNPDFLGSTPDQALSRLDRFELNRPETRDFFLDDRGVFEFGRDNNQVFYSRRIGLNLTDEGIQEVPLLYGLRMVTRTDSTQVGLLNVGLSPGTQRRPSVESSATVLRATQGFGTSRVGLIFLSQIQPGNWDQFLSYGVDGVLSLERDRLRVMGYWVGSREEGRAPGGAGNVALEWKSLAFYAGSSFTDVTENFSPQLGFFPILGVRTLEAWGGYTPPVNLEEVRQVKVETALYRTLDRNHSLVTESANLSLGAELNNSSTFKVTLENRGDDIVYPFDLADGRLNVAPGRYQSLLSSMAFSSAAGQPATVSVTYQEGGFFGGYQRVLSLLGTARAGLVVNATVYELYWIFVAGSEVLAHRLSESLTLAFTPQLLLSGVIEANTFDSRMLAQFLLTWTFSGRSTLVLGFTQSSPSAQTFFRQATLLGFARVNFEFSLF